MSPVPAELNIEEMRQPCSAEPVAIPCLTTVYYGVFAVALDHVTNDRMVL